MPPDNPTLREAAVIFLASLGPDERQEAQAEVNRFVRWYGSDRAMSELTGHDVSGYAASLGSSLADVASRLEPVRAFLAFAKKKGYTATNMAVHIRPPKAQKAIKTPARLKEAGPVSLSEGAIEAMKRELEELRARRPKVAAELRRAMADKDFRENAPLDAAREEQAHLEGRIREIESTLKRAVVIKEDKTPTASVNLGNTVIVRNLKSGAEIKYTLVSPHEVDPSQGKISIASPVGKALVRKREGDEVEVEAPAGAIRLRVERIQS
ncbi:MAG: GreA/GreB family elongation factor [Dehalococcoidia bacterium]|nr:GreA/GreB family elongation factor [Dehalococcoidia bacterium]